MKPKRIKAKPRNLVKVFEWLESIGLSVYGANMDPETGQGYYGCRDFTAKDAVKIARHVRKGTIKEPEEM